MSTASCSSTSPRRLNDVYITSAVRTPIGCFNGKLKDVPAVDLGAAAIKEAYTRNNLDPNDIDEVLMGHVLQAYCKQAPTRQAAIKAGLPVSVECTTINKLCASGMKSIMFASQSIQCDSRKIIIAGGMESMSQSPFLLPRATPKYGGQMIYDSILYDGLTCAFNNIHMGSCTEKMLKRFGITREEQDNYAIDSYQKNAHAMKSSVFEDEIIAFKVESKSGTDIVVTDEEPSRFQPDKILKLKPVFEKDGTITPANASKLNDGACALVLMSGDMLNEKNIQPLAKVVSFADGATEPADFGIAPSISIMKALDKANLKIEDISYWEINEAFSGVPLANIKKLGLNSSLVNIDGGAVAIGHPVGMSGARIVTHLVHRLKRDQIGLASICNGGGGSCTMIIQKL